MRILYVVPYLNKIGGIQSLAVTTSKQISKKDLVKVIDWRSDKSFLLKVLLRYLPIQVGSLLFRFTSKNLGTIFNTDKFDLIHFWHSDPAMTYDHKGFIVTCHGLEIGNKAIKGYRQKLYQKVFDNAALITVISNYAKELLLRNFQVNSKKIKVLPPTIDINYFSTHNIEKFREKRLVIGTVSRLIKRKNISNVIKALEILKERYAIDFIYHLAGDGPELSTILAQLTNSSFKWKYFGAISEKEKINKFYPSLDIFVMPPLDLSEDAEGFGIVYLEANAYGIPVVASRSGGVPDAVKEGVSGLFADPTSPEDIAKKIFKLSKDKDKYKKTARAWAKRFDSAVIAKQFMEVYKEVLAAK